MRVRWIARGASHGQPGGEYEVVLVARSDGLMNADITPAGAAVGAGHH